VAPEAAEVERPSSAGGWFADPFGRYQERYWDGQRWTAHVAWWQRPEIDPQFRDEDG
jgi:hypothetical protein